MNTSIANRKLTGLAAIVLAIAVGANIPASQALGQAPRVAADIPFDFQNGSDHLPAGRYIVSINSEHLMSLQGTKATSMALSRVEINSKPAANGKLVFDKYGSRYFLREVWLANQGEHQVLAQSKAEKRQQNALNATERDGTEVAVLIPLN
jgi:hypothetical protein